MMNIYIIRRLAWLVFIALLFSGCTNRPSTNAAIDIEQALSKKYPGINFSVIHTSANTENNAVTDQFSLQQAIQTLLSHSPQVRIQMAQLGIADAESLQAELIRNPHITLGAMKPEDSSDWKLEFGLSQPLLDLFTRPLRRQLAAESLINTQLNLQIQLQELIANTSELYFSAVADQQHVQIQDHMYQATLARQQLALSLYQAGNLSENNFLYYDNELRLAQKNLEERKANAQNSLLQLMNSLGLPSATPLRLPVQLTALPEENFDQLMMLEKAKFSRLDMQIINRHLTILEKRRQLVTQENGWRDMQAGINLEREPDGNTSVGPEIELSLPVFNRGQGKIAAMDAKIALAQAQLQKAGLDINTQVAQALNQMSSAKKQLTILAQAVQIAKKRVALSNREVNFMLTSPFELLAIKRQEIRLAHDYTDELKHYWHSRSQLELAIGQALPVNAITEDENHDHHMMDHDHHKHHQHKHHQQDSDAKKSQESDSHNHHQGH